MTDVWKTNKYNACSKCVLVSLQRYLDTELVFVSGNFIKPNDIILRSFHLQIQHVFNVLKLSDELIKSPVLTWFIIIPSLLFWNPPENRQKPKDLTHNFRTRAPAQRHCLLFTWFETIHNIVCFFCCTNQLWLISCNDRSSRHKYYNQLLVCSCIS